MEKGLQMYSMKRNNLWIFCEMHLAKGGYISQSEHCTLLTAHCFINTHHKMYCDMFVCKIQDTHGRLNSEH